MTTITIDLNPLLMAAEAREQQAQAMREQAARLAGEAEGLREAARLMTEQAKIQAQGHQAAQATADPPPLDEEG